MMYNPIRESCPYCGIMIDLGAEFHVCPQDTQKAWPEKDMQAIWVVWDRPLFAASVVALNVWLEERKGIWCLNLASWSERALQPILSSLCPFAVEVCERPEKGRPDIVDARIVRARYERCLPWGWVDGRRLKDDLYREGGIVTVRFERATYISMVGVDTMSRSGHIDDCGVPCPPIESDIT
jgi:hypothetical protein